MMLTLIWPQGSVVVFGSWPNWTKEDMTSEDYCKATPMLFAFVLQIVRWVSNEHRDGTMAVLKSSLAKASTALHRSMIKYLTVQDTRGTTTLTKHNRTLVRLGNLLYFQPPSTIKVNLIF